MCKKAFITLSTEAKDNGILEKIISPLNGVIDFDKIISGRKFFDRAELPFIKTDEGDNYFGLERIRFFVKREIKRRKA